MKKIPVVVLLLLFSCNSNRAATPQELVKNVVDNNVTKMSEFMKYIPKEDHPVVAFSYDFIAAFLTQFTSNEDVKDRYKNIRKKYRLPDTIDISKKIDLKNPLTMIAFAQKNYDINCIAFVAEIEEFLNFADPKHAVSYEHAKIVDLITIEIDGKNAIGLVKYENGKSEEVPFVEIDGVWYFSIKESLLKRYIVK